MESGAPMNYHQLTRREYNSLLAECYSVIYTAQERPWGDSLSWRLESLVPNPAGKVLDLGCGYGRNFRHIVNAATQVLAIDLCPTALHCAERSYHSAVEQGKLKVICGDEKKVSGSFDVIVCAGLLVDHLNTRRGQIAEALADSLRSGGLLFVNVFGDNDPACGRGAEVEENTYVHELGFPVHYFSEPELLSLFPSLRVVEVDRTRIPDAYPTPHSHEIVVALFRQGNTPNKASGTLQGREQ